MKKILITLLFGFITITVLSQDSIKIEEFKHAINRQFTKITTGTAFSNMGNFASVSTDAKSFAVGGNIVSKGSVWGIELSGGATEGIFKIFSSDELNTSFSGELKYHKLLKTYFAARNFFDVKDIEDQILTLDNQFSKDSLAIEQQRDLYKIQQDIIISENKITELTSQISKDSMLLRIATSQRAKDSLEAAKGTHEFELENHKLSIVTWRDQLSRMSAVLDLEKKDQVRDKAVKELEKKKLNLELPAFDISWLSFGLRAKNNEIKLFNPLNLPATQYSDTSFVSQRFTASLSRYRSTSYQSQDLYWSAGIFLDYTTNFNSLKKVEIEERIPVPGNSQQEFKKTINAYQGDYKEDIVEFTMFYDYYRFFGKSTSLFAIHFNPSVSYSEITKKPLTNLFLGVILPFMEKEKQVSKINLELFYNRQDVFNYLHKKTKNSSFGIRATLPITIINNKS